MISKIKDKTFYTQQYYKNAENFDKLILAISIAIIGYINHKYIGHASCLYKICISLLFLSIILSCVSYLLSHSCLEREVNGRDHKSLSYLTTIIWMCSGISFILSMILLWIAFVCL